MSLKSKAKYTLSKMFPAKVKLIDRTKKGVNLNDNPFTLLVYEEDGEASLKEVKNVIRHLKGEFGIREILAITYADVSENEIPVYLGHLKELDFISREDLNWRCKPHEFITELNRKNIDLLIDLTQSPMMPLEFVIAESNARLKVGRTSSEMEKYMDVVLSLGDGSSNKDFLKHVEYYLSNLSFN